MNSPGTVRTLEIQLGHAIQRTRELRRQNEELRKTIRSQRDTLRDVRESRDKWKRLCQGYENDLGHRRPNRQPKGLREHQSAT